MHPKAPGQHQNYRISQGRNGLEITIDPKRHAGQSLILLVWLAGWAAGEIAVLRELTGSGDDGNRVMLVVFLAAWTLAGLMAAKALLFSLGGRERIRINSVELEHRLEAPMVGQQKTYDMSRISNLRAGRPAPAQYGRPADRRPRKGRIRQSGRITFDYDGNPVSFGQSLSNEDAEALVRELHTRFRQLEPGAPGAGA